MGKEYNNDVNSNGHVQELLSAYIDKSLEEPDTVRVRAHLEGCADCRAEYVGLQATRRMLQQMPIVAVPRAFTLTPEMVKGARKTSLLERIFAPRSVPTFASGSVVAFALLLFLFVSANFSQESIMTASAPVPLADTYAATPPADALRSMEAQPTSGAAAGDQQPSESSGSVAKQSPTQPAADVAVAPPAPDATPLPGGMGGEAQSGMVTTPNTEVTNTGTSSPTTMLYDPSGAGNSTAAGADADNISPESIQQTPTAPTPLASEFNLLLAVEIGLLVVGVALAVAALISRRRTI